MPSTKYSTFGLSKSCRKRRKTGARLPVFNIGPMRPSSFELQKRPATFLPLKISNDSGATPSASFDDISFHQSKAMFSFCLLRLPIQIFCQIFTIDRLPMSKRNGFSSPYCFAKHQSLIRDSGWFCMKYPPPRCTSPIFFPLRFLETIFPHLQNAFT